ncbi:nucleotide sugar dehydrogenase [Lentibacillus saliphilus]|uniref:nucleotide sugar dehydrogenase n=1 Tax=Lentibacillus saliphilus TaxID=2737028 RepID=UPI001C30D684|nr:nucleotide sugar dehydrogenase [Lentibacillus saliphilus]
MEDICVIGLGYIGLPTSGHLSSKGYNVLGVDTNRDIIEALKNGHVLIEEPDLKTLIKDSIHRGKLSFSLEPQKSDAFIIAVPTPIFENHTANLDYVKQAIRNILPYLEKGNLIIVESTIPPRTIDDVVVPLLQEGGFSPQLDEVFVAHCPERVIPGRILVELNENTRVVGGYTEQATRKAANLYRDVIQGDVYETSAVTAEMVKLMENTYRDVNIALANELAKISHHLGVNAHDVVELANMHPRVNLHQPGPGVGGHCISVDPYFIIEKAQDLSPLMQTARKVNLSMPDFVVEQIENMIHKNKQSTISVLGLTYKGNTDDLRESPALIIVDKLISKGYHVKCHDPHVKQNMTDLDLFSLEESLTGADIAVILADHNAFKRIESSIFTKHMGTPTIFDTKSCLQELNGVKLYQIGDLSEYSDSKYINRVSS